MAVDLTGNPWIFDAATQGEGIANASAQMLVGDVVPEADDEIFTMAGHGFSTGSGPIQLAGTTAPTGTAKLTDYWVIRIAASTFYLATTHANAIAETNLTISSDGTSVTVTRLPVFPVPLYVRSIVIDAGATGGTFAVHDMASGRPLTGTLSIAANAHEQIVIDDFVGGVYMTSMADGQILVYHGRPSHV